MGLLKEHFPCLPCLLSTYKIRLPTVQHVVAGMKRTGQTYSSCDWHHLGCNGDFSKQEMMGLLGPSFAHGRKPFEAVYGTEQVLVKVQDFLVAWYRKDPWLDYAVPRTASRRAYLLWHRLR